MKKIISKWKRFLLSYRLDDAPHQSGDLPLEEEESRFLAEHQAMIDTLRSTSDSYREDPSVFLRDRILNEIRAIESPAPRRNPTFNFPVLRPYLMGICCLALISFGLFKIHKDRQVAIQDEAVSHATRQVVDLVDFAERFPIIHLGTQLEQPMEKEMENVLSDARNAMNSLTKAFVPQTLLASSSVDVSP